MARGRRNSPAAAIAAVPRARGKNRPQVPFTKKLVLNQWLLSLFNTQSFEELAEYLRNEALEGLDENNIHHFHHALTSQLFKPDPTPDGVAA